MARLEGVAEAAVARIHAQLVELQPGQWRLQVDTEQGFIVTGRARRLQTHMFTLHEALVVGVGTDDALKHDVILTVAPIHIKARSMHLGTR